MPTELIASKLFIPPLRQSLVPRPRLIQILNDGLDTKRKLTLISAPAGFGKTTLVVDWLNQIGIPTAWLSLDETDNDLQRFLAYLSAAVQQVDEELGAPLGNVLQSPQLPTVEKALVGLLNEIAIRPDPIILVLDDYHLLKEAEVVMALRFLLDHQPPQLHMVLMTREDPDLPLARLRARDQLTEIRASDLRFTQVEADRLLRSVMGVTLSEQDVTALEDRTEGWAVGLQLAGLSLQKQADLKSFIADFSGSHRHILDYLTEEVLQQQPENIRMFLLRTSILERFCAELCEAVNSDPMDPRAQFTVDHSPSTVDYHLLLDHLEHANLFIIPLDNERRWYRYHHLFSDLLRSQLARSQPEWIPVLHRRASRWYEEHRNIPAAIDHALQDTDLAQAARLIEQHTLTMLYQGQVAMVVGWFDRLPDTVLEPAPMLCISKAWALALMERKAGIEGVERALQAAAQALERTKAGEALRNLISGHAASIRAFYLQTSTLNSKQAGTLLDLAQEAQRLLPAEEKAIRSVNNLILGHGYQALADLESARRAFRQTLVDGLAGGNVYAAIYGPINLITIELLLGNLREALQLCSANIERFNQILAGQNFPSIGALYILKGTLLFEYDHRAEAERALTEGLDLLRWTEENDARYRGYTALARLHAIQGDRPALLEAVKTMEETWPGGAFYAQTVRHRLLLRHWPDDPEVRKDAQVWLNQCGIAFDRLAVIDGVDPISQRDFEGYLGATHVLARLAKWKPGVYPLDETLAFLKRQVEFAKTHGMVSWVVAVFIARTVLYQAAGKKDQAIETLRAALCAAAPTELFRIFVDECEPLQDLLEELTTQLKDEALIAYANRLLAAMNCGPAKPEPADRGEAASLAEPLSERELEVLRSLAAGLTYEEIGRQLFLSLNTVQFHVKNIYGKLMVNKRLQAIERAREMKLI